MTEKEKVLAGELYDATDPQLVAARRGARDLLHGLDHSRDPAGAAAGPCPPVPRASSPPATPAA